MLIAIDIGNSSINIGFFTNSGLFVLKIATWPLKTPSEYSLILNRFIKEKNIFKKPKGVIISSVVPGHTEVLAEASKGLKPENLLIMSPEINTGLVFVIPKPEELGSDRIVNAVAAYEIFKGPVAVVDFGTATTISVVGKDANYMGGVILPGLGLMNKSLAKGTSKLSEITLSPPLSALGINTSRCIQSGIFYGTAGAIERLLQEIEKEVEFGLKIVVTGGYGGIISRFLQREYTMRPNLTLEGLKIIYMRNKDE
jgi:type III pantothenate kinase